LLPNYYVFEQTRLRLRSACQRLHSLANMMSLFLQFVQMFSTLRHHTLIREHIFMCST